MYVGLYVYVSLTDLNKKYINEAYELDEENKKPMAKGNRRIDGKSKGYSS